MSLRLTGLRWSAGGTPVLDDFTATAPGGRLTGVLGPNGAGKSSLLRVVAGVLVPDAGMATLDGVDLLAQSRRERARRVAFVEQEAPSSLPLRVRDAVELGRTPHLARWGGLTAADHEIVDAALASAGVSVRRSLRRRLSSAEGSGIASRRVMKVMKIIAAPAPQSEGIQDSGTPA